MSVALFAYQKQGIKELFQAIREGDRRLIWCYPTGAGKSTLSSGLIEILLKSQKKSLFVVHRRQLVEQFSERLKDQFDIDSGIIMSRVDVDKQQPVQVASIQTVIRRDMSWFDPDIVLIDEAHRATSMSYSLLIEKYAHAILLLLTATPFRGDGSGLGSIADRIIHPITTQELIDINRLVGTQVYGTAIEVDLKGIKTVKGDYDKKELFKRYDNDVSYKSVIENYLDYAKGKKAIAFNINVAHSKAMNQAFLEAGIRSAHLDGETSDSERESVMKAYENDEIDVLNNVALFIEGYDVPKVECIILNGATKSLGRYVQMVGRGVRYAEGKKVCIVLDHGGNTNRHLYMEDYDKNGFDLSGLPRITKKMQRLKSSKMRQCPKCRAVLKNGMRSCRCGHAFQSVVKEYKNDVKIKLLDRDTVRIGRIEDKSIGSLKPHEVRIFQKIKGYKAGWAYWHCVKEYHWKLPSGKEGYMAANHLLSLEELQHGTYQYVKQLQARK